MPDEKSITRYFPLIKKATDTFEMLPAKTGEWVKCDDHLAALGEAEAEKVAETRRAVRDAEAVARQESVLREAAEQSLQTLRLGLEAEVERLGKEAARDEALGDEQYDDGALADATRAWARCQTSQAHADRLRQLLDQPSETAGES